MAINHKQPCLIKFSSNVVPVVTTNGVFKLHFLLITDPVARFQSKTVSAVVDVHLFLHNVNPLCDNLIQRQNIRNEIQLPPIEEHVFVAES